MKLYISNICGKFCNKRIRLVGVAGCHISADLLKPICSVISQEIVVGTAE